MNELPDEAGFADTQAPPRWPAVSSGPAGLTGAQHLCRARGSVAFFILAVAVGFAVVVGLACFVSDFSIKWANGGDRVDFHLIFGCRSQAIPAQGGRTPVRRENGAVPDDSDGLFTVPAPKRHDAPPPSAPIRALEKKSDFA